MSNRISLCSILVASIVCDSCLAPDLWGEVDLIPPAVVGLSLGKPDAVFPPTVGGLAEITIRFSEPLDPWTVGPETLLVIRGKTTDSCVATGYCLAGHCLGESCQGTAVDTAFQNDANSPPLSVSRQALAHPVEVELDAGGDHVLLRPLRPYDAQQLYTVLVSSAVRDRAGNPLVAADGRWEGFAYDFVAGAEPIGPPAVELVWPEPDAVDVPPNLGEVLIGFDAPVNGAIPAGVWLVGGSRTVAAQVSDGAQRCAENAPSCLVLTLGEALEVLARYDLAWAETLTGPDGAPVPLPEIPVGFTTGAAIDESPPVVSDVTLTTGEGCLQVSFYSDESAQAIVRLVGPGGLMHEAGPGPWGCEHSWQLDAPTALAELYLQLADPFENSAEHGPFGLGDLTFHPAVVISEVLANPAGAEPAQEFVEIVNVSSQPVSLEGWRIRDDPAREGDLLPAVVLAPGAVALVVPETYDELSADDPAVDPGAVLLRLDNGTLGSSGLSNGGEPVMLYDALDVERSTFGGTDAGGALPVNGQSVMRLLGNGCAERGAWQLHPAGVSSPGWLD